MAPLAVVLVLFLVPAGSTAIPLQKAAPATLAAGPRIVSGTVVNCTTRVECSFSFNGSSGTGWANVTASGMDLQLPGEAKASYNLPYSTYIARLTGTYTYWTVGSFVGTDVNTGYVIYGTTNTNYTITCHGHSGRGGGCTYTYTTDNGTIEVQFTHAEMTSTSLSCSPTSTHPGGKVSCTVNVTNTWNSSNVPTGAVKISTGRTGTLSDKGTCTLSAGSCSFTYRPYDNTCGSAVLTATHPGTRAFYKSGASVTISVIVSGGC